VLPHATSYALRECRDALAEVLISLTGASVYTEEGVRAPRSQRFSAEKFDFARTVALGISDGANDRRIFLFLICLGRIDHLDFENY
jgi:hypothetical protein